MDFVVIGAAGLPLTLRATADGDTVQVTSDVLLTPSEKRSLDQAKLGEQLGRLGETPFELGAIDHAGLHPACFFR